MSGGCGFHPLSPAEPATAGAMHAPAATAISAPGAQADSFQQQFLPVGEDRRAQILGIQAAGFVGCATPHAPTQHVARFAGPLLFQLSLAVPGYQHLLALETKYVPAFKAGLGSGISGVRCGHPSSLLSADPTFCTHPGHHPGTP